MPPKSSRKVVPGRNRTSRKIFSKVVRGTLEELLSWGESQLIPKIGRIEARTGVERMLEEILGCDRLRLHLEAHRKVSAEAQKRFRRWVVLRKKRVPLDYLFGKTHFWNEVLEVGPACLIPRPSTEILVEKFLEKSGFGREDHFFFLDLGCGSGAIGIAVLREFPRARAVFADISGAAIAVTKRNLKRYRLQERANVLKSDLFSAFGKKEETRFDVVLSNPPYLSARDMGIAQPEVLFEPHVALKGGADGFRMYRRILCEVPDRLVRGGLLVLEMGKGQAKKISGFCAPAFTDIQIYKDYAGIDRVLMAKKNG